ncbi:MAG: hypothetical protein L6R38_003076 [Xanthoria sp. 2 TBL-2021]|nr:MAG: hypothetical protein L6R38_003076 [Xanthoria sp. 2 TBL-2021]
MGEETSKAISTFPPTNPQVPTSQTTDDPVTIWTSSDLTLSTITSSSPTSTATTSRRSTRSFTSPTKPEESTEHPLPTANPTEPTGNSTSTSTSRESEPATTSNPPPPANPAPDANPPPPTSKTDKLIAGIGVPLGCILLAFTAIYLLHRRKKHKSQQHKRLQHEEKIRNWYTPVVRRGPHELDTRLISRPYMKPELSEEARRHVVEVSADDLQEVRSMRASVVHQGGGGRKSRSTVIEEWIRNQPRTWI